MGYRYRGPRGYRRGGPWRFLWLIFFLPAVAYHSEVAFGVLIVVAIALFIIIRAAAASSFSGMNRPPVNIPPQQTYQPYQPPYQQPYESPYQPYESPYQPYEQGYQSYQPPVTNQQSAQPNAAPQYESPQYEEQPQAQYPEELPPMEQ